MGKKLPTSRESVIQAACISLFRLNRWVCTRVSATPIKMQNKNGSWRTFTPKSFDKGTADYICGVNGQAVYVEFKKPGKRQSPDQILFQQQVERARCLYVVIESVEQAETLVERMR